MKKSRFSRLSTTDLLTLLTLVAGQGWRVTYKESIRNEDGRCPLCALGHTLIGTQNIEMWQYPISELSGYSAHNLPETIKSTCRNVASAADHNDAAFRSDLMYVLGMI